MASLLDILTATFIGAILILMIIGISFYIQNSSHEVINANIAQVNLKEIAEVLEYDLYKIGYRVPSNKILEADSTRIRFQADLNNDGKIDTVYYLLGNPNELAETPNPRDRILYRIENNERLRGSNLGVVDFKLTYYDSSNTKINYNSLTSQNSRDKIRSIEFYVRVETLYPIEGYYPGAEMKRTIKPKNLR